MFSFSFPPVSNFSVFFTCSLSFVSFFSVFLLGGIYRGKRERDRPYPCPIVAHGESGLPALSRCGARWPIGVACMAWPPGFSSEAGRNKEEKTKNLSSPIARLGEEKGGTMSLKMTLFFLTWNGDVWLIWNSVFTTIPFNPKLTIKTMCNLVILRSIWWSSEF